MTANKWSDETIWSKLIWCLAALCVEAPWFKQNKTGESKENSKMQQLRLQIQCCMTSTAASYEVCVQKNIRRWQQRDPMHTAFETWLHRNIGCFASEFLLLLVLAGDSTWPGIHAKLLATVVGLSRWITMVTCFASCPPCQLQPLLVMPNCWLLSTVGSSQSMKSTGWHWLPAACVNGRCHVIAPQLAKLLVVSLVNL